jgi:GNAT superfamily N-acetyltransferase
MPHVVRQVLPSEYSKYSVHLKRLDQDSKILRFGAPINDSIIDKLCHRIEQNWQNHILFCIENNDLDFVAMGHIALGNRMELAFSTLKEHQGQGMGSVLIQRCIQYCRAHNILNGHMMCLSQNSVIRHLCSKHGIIMHSESGETTAEIELSEPDINTYVQESIDAGVSTLDYLNKRLWFTWRKLSLSAC